MKLYTERLEFNKNISTLEEIRNEIEKPNKEILRFAIVKKEKNRTVIEVSFLEDDNRMEIRYNIPYEHNNKFIVINVVPTGIRAEVGGFIADMTPFNNVLSSVVDKVITHPNAVNGSFLNYMSNNTLYVEGYSLDNFLQNKVAIQEILSNKIGVIVDKGAIDEDPNCVNEIINTINAYRVITGINVIGYVVTDEPIGGHAIQMPSGAFCGEVKNPQTMIRAASELILKGASAIAITTYISIDNLEDDLDKYFKGNLANPFGGTEALISHTISKIFGIPCAHAPVLSKKEKDYYNSAGVVDSRASSEVVSSSYLGCILRGLSKAPQLGNTGITLSDVKAIILPYGCCGGIPALMAQKFNIPLICVKENKTVLDVTSEKMGMNAIVVENYWEAVGVVAALKSGISIESLRRPIKSVKELRS
jgi:hypothetical protein